MKLTVKTNFAAVKKAWEQAAGQVPYALSVALNNTAEKGRVKVRAEMPKVFDRPTPWVLNSLRVKRSTKTNLTAELAYKDKNLVESARSMVEPHVFGGRRHFKAMEARLLAIGLMPKGYNAVPGEAAKLDAYGNMSRGQISQLLNVLGAYTEAGYNKANDKTVKRLLKGNIKRNVYGFEYFVSHGRAGQEAISVRGGEMVRTRIRQNHLQPGVYQRVVTGFGTSIKPILIFVKQAAYKKRLPFYEMVQEVVDKEFRDEFDRSFAEAMRTALLKTQGELL